MRRFHLALAVAVTALLIMAGGALAIRTSAAPGTLAFVGGRGGVAAAPGTPAAPVPTRPPAGPRSLPFSNPVSIDAALIASIGYRFPPGANVYAAKITKEAGGLTYEDFEGGGGALGRNFWPASSIKVFAAVGALEYIGQQGFTGAATVNFGSGAPRTVRSIYDGAIRISDNADYDLLVEIAGVDWLNKEFLTPARGFPRTVIQRSYTVGGNLRATPAITLSEGGRTVTIPARNGKVDTDCAQGQCSDLFEMSESVRRVVLHNEITTDVPDTLGRTVYRIVQESLTNARRHAAGSTVDITVRDAGGLAVEIVNTAGEAGEPGGGHGIPGLRERAALAGGRVDAGPEPGGGWRVSAWLPWPA